MTATAAAAVTRMVKIADLRIDPKIQIRRLSSREDQKRHEDAVRRYMEWLTRTEAPPVTVVELEDHTLVLADGFTRTASYDRSGRTEIPATIYQGDLNLAAELAVAENLYGKEALTTDERADAINRMKMLHGNWTQQDIADFMQISIGTVQRTMWASEVRGYVMWSPVKRFLGEVSDTILAEIHSAPKEHWQELCKAYDARGWSRPQVIEAVRMIKTPGVPDSQKRALLAGKINPGDAVVVDDRRRQRRANEPLDPVEPFALGAPTPTVPADEDDEFEEELGGDPVGSNVGERLAFVILDMNVGVEVPGKTRWRGRRQYRREVQRPPRPYRLLFTREEAASPELFGEALRRRAVEILTYEGYPERERVWGAEV